MSFVNNENGTRYDAGYFLAKEDCTRVSYIVSNQHSLVRTAENGGKYVPAGAAIPASGAEAKGLLYEDTDVTNGSAPCSIVVEGVVYGERLPGGISQATLQAIGGGISVVTDQPIIRPEDD